MTSSVMVVVGTRPEAIKMAPLVHALLAQEKINLHFCTTGQHQAMLQQVLDLFELEATIHLKTMATGQTLNTLLPSLITQLDRVYTAEEPDLILVHGDTATCFAATLAAFHRGLPIAHVEAGLRSGDRQLPHPEEAYRRMTTCLAALHFAPTQTARTNLLNEGVPDKAISVTGNTVIDALLWVRDRLPSQRRQLSSSDLDRIRSEARVVLVTSHRRENFGKGLQNICAAITLLAQRYPDIDFVYPVHLNPRVRDLVHQRLALVPNIHLLEPLDYRSFVWLMDRSTLILTDSGGIQEEAPGLGIPVLVMRDQTERPEAVGAGTVKLVGNETGRIVEEVIALLESPTTYQRMQLAGNPYGDGHASQRIVKELQQWFDANTEPGAPS
ncbi:non-hydrolyzing UDP-N-acetylglucosamine 2-epimerase [Litchfieldella xinjiangensis]|uniref:non-hydrolyzing UDP-N-acetylglucosamine 2-epimerase n=1 Tax=Litchfieldella xinjiangensis TaxID=1166948 RepID=UPI0005BA8BFA|nr:UDP-N-acetylglucosamine 2-epimerase (non-hydrolyzing) [Halomonas xinjiangensis]